MSALTDSSPQTVSTVVSPPRQGVLELIRGALLLRSATFQILRERSDVFYRGFLVVLTVALIAGVFEAAANLVRAANPPTQERVTQGIISQIQNSNRGSADMTELIAPYVREGVSMVYELMRLPPRAGEEARPLVRALQFLGQTLAEPFSSNFMQYLLFSTLLVQVASKWLGGRATIAQMLGLAALSYAPELLHPISTLLVLGRDLSGNAALSSLQNLVGLAIGIWRLAIYIKATSIAQQFSVGSAVLALVIALAIVIGVVIVLGVLVFVLFGGLLATIAGASR